MQSQAIAVKELMVPRDQYATVSHEGTLRDAVLALQEAQKREQRQNPDRHRDRAVLVTDNEAQVLGKLSMLDVLRGLGPKYDRFEGSRASSRAATRVGSAHQFIDSLTGDFGLWQKPLSNLVQKASMVKVSHLIGPLTPSETIDENAPLDAALHQLVMGEFQSLLVTRGRKTMGVLRLTDVYDLISEMIISCEGEPGGD